MLDLSLLFGFVIAALVVLVIPGPGVLYVVARSISQGYSGAFFSALGLSTGVLVHVAACALGLSAVLLTSSLAFNVIKFLGAGYLVYLGIQMVCTGRPHGTLEQVQKRSRSRLFKEGIMVSALNPKISVFFLAFLPQFLDPASGSGPMQFVLLGLIYACLALVTDMAYGVFAITLQNRLRGGATLRKVAHYAGGSLLVGLGARAALSSQNT